MKLILTLTFIVLLLCFVNADVFINFDGLFKGYKCCGGNGVQVESENCPTASCQWCHANCTANCSPSCNCEAAKCSIQPLKVRGYSIVVNGTSVAGILRFSAEYQPQQSSFLIKSRFLSDLVTDGDIEFSTGSQIAFTLSMIGGSIADLTVPASQFAIILTGVFVRIDTGPGYEGLVNLYREPKTLEDESNLISFKNCGKYDISAATQECESSSNTVLVDFVNSNECSQGEVKAVCFNTGASGKVARFSECSTASAADACSATMNGSVASFSTSLGCISESSSTEYRHLCVGNATQ